MLIAPILSSPYQVQRMNTPSKAGPERYAGRPLLIVLENYVLDCIGELAPEKQAIARTVVQRVWGGGEDWKGTVRQQLKLQPAMDEALRGMWSRNQQIAQEQKVVLAGDEFARMVVDQNFAHLIG
jgi:hypothetical protein